MPDIAHLGDTITHGGEIITASDNVYAQGRRVARVGDLAMCLQDGIVKIVTGANTVLVNGQPAAHDGSLCSCGALVIASGSVKVE